MDFLTQIIGKVGGEDAINIINDQITPLILNTLRPNISNYIGSHVERTREELYNQLPRGVHDVLDDILPGGLNPNNGSQRGIGDVSRGFLDDIQDKIRQKIGEILNEIGIKVRQVVQDVTSSTNDRVTGSVVDIAKSKLKLGAQRSVQNIEQPGNSGNFNSGTRDVSRGQGDFLENFINSSLNEIRPLVKSELKSVYNHILEIVPQDARKILCAIVPGLDDNQSQQQNFNSNNQQFNQGNSQGGNGGQQFNNQGQGNQNYGNQPSNQGQSFNYQGDGQMNQQNSGQNFNNQPGNYNQNQNNQQNLNNSRGISDDNQSRDRGFMSDMLHKVKDEFKQGGLGNLLNSGSNNRSSGDLLEEFQAKARQKVDVITTQVMTLLEEKIMNTVSQELTTIAREKMNKFSL